MQLSLPSKTPDLLPAPAPAAIATADAALLAPSLESAAPLAFAALLAGQKGAPGALSVAAGVNPFSTGQGIPPSAADIAAAADVAALQPAAPVAIAAASNALTAQTNNPLVALSVETAPRVTKVAGEIAVSQEASATPPVETPAASKLALPRALSRATRVATRAEEEQVAALSLAAPVLSTTVPPVAVLSFDVSPIGEIAPVANVGATDAGSIAQDLPPVVSLAVAAGTASELTDAQTMRAAKFFWTKNNLATSTPVQAGPVKFPSGSEDGESEPVLPGAPEVAAQIVGASANSWQPAKAFSRVTGTDTPLPFVDTGSRATPVPQTDTPTQAGVVTSPFQMTSAQEGQEAVTQISTATSPRPTQRVALEIGTAVAITPATAGAVSFGGNSGPVSSQVMARASAENFSTPLTNPANTGSLATKSVGLKKILNAQPQMDSEEPTGLGIGVAQSNGKMRNDSQSSFSAFQQVEEISVASSAVAGLREALAALTPEPTPVASPRVQSVVNYVVEAAQRLDSHAVSSMDLRFNFGSSDKLSVHVELRDGAVHTTFRTDSSTLRETIGTAWREMAPANTISEGRSVRLADPTIVRETPAAEFSNQRGDGGDSRRDPHQQQQAAEFAESSFALAAGRTRAVRRLSALVEPITAPLSLRPETALHLHAVA